MGGAGREWAGQGGNGRGRERTGGALREGGSGPKKKGTGKQGFADI